MEYRNTKQNIIGKKTTCLGKPGNVSKNNLHITL